MKPCYVLVMTCWNEDGEESEFLVKCSTSKHLIERAKIEREGPYYTSGYQSAVYDIIETEFMEEEDE